jgi:hypothetical protein
LKMASKLVEVEVVPALIEDFVAMGGTGRGVGRSGWEVEWEVCELCKHGRGPRLVSPRKVEEGNGNRTRGSMDANLDGGKGGYCFASNPGG